MPSWISLTTLDSALAAVESLRPVAASHAAESEQLRTLAPAVVAALRSSNLLGFAAPRALGGGEQGPRAQLEVFEAMARIDTATGWALMISSMLTAVAGAYLHESAAQEVFADGPPACAGLLTPGGLMQPVPGGYRVSGRWAFGSGIRHADWIVTSAAVPPDLSSSSSSSAQPELWTIVVRAQHAQIEDTWFAAGLRGSGSEHYRLEDVFVPESHTFRFPDAPVQRGGAYFQLPLIALLVAAHAGFALGSARAALDALPALAARRVKVWSGTTLSQHAGFHMQLGRMDAKLRAARALAMEAVDRLEARAEQRRSLTLDDWATARLAVSHCTEVAAEVASFAFHAGGSSALYESSPLQRLFRDVHAAGQHVAATDEAYEFAGRLLLGMATAHPLTTARQPTQPALVPAVSR